MAIFAYASDFELFCPLFIWLSRDQLWATVREVTSLTQFYLLRSYYFEPMINDKLATRLTAFALLSPWLFKTKTLMENYTTIWRLGQDLLTKG